MIRRATLFIDWDTARRIGPRRSLRDRGDIAGVLMNLQRAVGAAIEERDKVNSYRVSWRFYHGWYRGKTKTLDRQELENAVRPHDKWWITSRRVSFTPECAYSDEMICSTRQSHLYDTLRRRDDGRDEQKMVDTVLVCDLLQFVRSKIGDVAIILADDDDILPGIFQAEAWLGQVWVFRLRDSRNKYMNTVGLVSELRVS